MSRFAVVIGICLALRGLWAEAQEIQRPVRAVGDWCEYAVEGIGVKFHKREVVEITPDGGYTMKFTSDSGPDELYVFNGNYEMIGRNGREQKNISQSGPLYPISAQSRGRVTRFSYPHNRRPGVIVEVTSEIKAVDAENVTVPAGSFDTLRVRTVSNYRFADGSYSNQWVDTLWYSLDSKVKFPVKMEYIDHGLSNSRRIRQLMKCGTAQAK